MSSKVLLCKQCGRLFQSAGSSYCPACAEEMDQAFNKVKEYIYNNEDATIMEIVENTGVAEKQVLYFLKEGRLSVDNTEGMLRCEECGRPISSGRYCSVCRDKLANALGSVYPAPNGKLDSGEKMQARMHSRYGNR